MAELEEIVSDEEVALERIIGRIDGPEPGPCLIFFAGIHGNEPSGVFALRQVLAELSQHRTVAGGSIIGIAGNLWALQRSKRFHTKDLNRLWTKEQIKALMEASVPLMEDQQQQKEIYELLQHLLSEETGPFYFFDLHTTSAPSDPFITVNDSLLNRRFTRQYPVPLILGIEEYLEGALLSYINELGYISFGFEGGQHEDPSALENHKMFIYLSLVFAGMIAKSHIPFDQYMSQLQGSGSGKSSFYEIYNRYEIQPDEEFVMKPGFSNFQKVSKGAQLASSNGQPLTLAASAILFMPLYQAQGTDGYFLIRKIPIFFLWLSAILRWSQADRLFTLLPGVHWYSKERKTMIVDLRIARYVARHIFHLFGYLSKKKGSRHLIIKNREYGSKTNEYRGAAWW